MTKPSYLGVDNIEGRLRAGPRTFHSLEDGSNGESSHWPLLPQHEFWGNRTEGAHSCRNWHSANLENKRGGSDLLIGKRSGNEVELKGVNTGNK